MAVILSVTVSSAIGALTCALVCWAIVGSSGWHARWTVDSNQGIQKFHVDPTPRVAGLGVLLGLSCAYYWSSGDLAALFGPMLMAGLPAFIAGLLEDLTKRVGVGERLAATFVSGLAAWWLTGISLQRIDVWGFDLLLTWLPLSVSFTAFALAGLANAVNMIDGFNGLAGGVVVVCLLALSACAHLAGDMNLAHLCLIVAAVMVGFLILNFPFGKIFLGDGGAYLIGFCLGWLAVLLSYRNPQISPWTSLLICAYPIIEVLFSIWRRLSRKEHVGSADRLHLHSLIKTRIVRKKLSGLSTVMRNAAVSPVIWFFSIAPALTGLAFRHDTKALIVAFLIYTMLYALLYRRLVRFGWFR